MSVRDDTRHVVSAIVMVVSEIDAHWLAFDLGPYGCDTCMQCVIRVDVFVDIEVLHRDADAALACIAVIAIANRRRRHLYGWLLRRCAWQPYSSSSSDRL